MEIAASLASLECAAADYPQKQSSSGERRTFLDALLLAHSPQPPSPLRSKKHSALTLDLAVAFGEDCTQLRNVSTASTPIGSCTSESSSRSASPSTSGGCTRRHSWIDQDSTADDSDEESESSQSECEFDCATDDEVAEGTGVPIDGDDRFAATSAAASDAENDTDVTSCTADLDISFRSRHRLLGKLKAEGPCRWDRDVRKNRRPHNSSRDLRHFRTPSSSLRLRIASANVCTEADRRHNTRVKATDASRRPIASPYGPPLKPWQQDQSQADDDQAADDDSTKHHTNGKVAGKLERVRLNCDVRKLATKIRPALTHARSTAHRLVLANRAARKIQIKQATALASMHTPKHLRSSSVDGDFLTAAMTSSLSPQASSRVRPGSASSFDQFRRLFYLKHRAALEGAFDANGGGIAVDAIRLCPINSLSQSRFMTRLRQLHPNEADIPLVYHGTRLANMDSICRRGLLVPGETSGVGVANGSAYGVGIYSATSACTSTGYARDTSTLFVCAALTKGAKNATFGGTEAEPRSPPPEVVTAHGFVVLMQEARICPLFLLDYSWVDRATANVSPPTANDPPIRASFARALLRLRHTRKRRAWHTRGNEQHNQLHRAAQQHSSEQSALVR